MRSRNSKESKQLIKEQILRAKKKGKERVKSFSFHEEWLSSCHPSRSHSKGGQIVVFARRGDNALSAAQCSPSLLQVLDVIRIAIADTAPPHSPSSALSLIS